MDPESGTSPLRRGHPPAWSVREVSPRMLLLLDSAVAVVAGRGLRGLTHRAVDREAGLPEGSCSAYLRTRAALLTALAGHVAGELSADVAELAEGLGPGPLDLDAAVFATEDLVLRWLEHPELIITRGELGLEAVRTPEVERAFASWRETLLDIIQRIVEETGRPDPRVRAQALLASIEGILLTALSFPAASREAYVADTVRVVLAGVTGGPAVVSPAEDPHSSG